MSSNPFTQGPSRRVVLYAGLEIAIGSLAYRALPAGAQPGSPDLATRAIPHSGERLPVIGLGTANDFQVAQQGEAKATLKKVVDDLLAQGCKLIDTASSYGSAESVLGDLLSDQDRSKIFLATKLENGSQKADTIEFKRSLEGALRGFQFACLQSRNTQVIRGDGVLGIQFERRLIVFGGVRKIVQVRVLTCHQKTNGA